MKKLILSLIFAIILFAGFNTSEAKASEISDLSVKRTAVLDIYMYVKVYENGKFWIYTYTTDGVFVSKVEAAN